MIREFIGMMFVALIMILYGSIAVLYIPAPIINVFHFHYAINKTVVGNLLLIIFNILNYFMLFCIVFLIDDSCLLYLIHRTDLYFPKQLSKYLPLTYNNSRKIISIVNEKFNSMITESFLILALLYIVYYIVKTSYMMYRRKHLNRHYGLERYLMILDLKNFFMKIIIYMITTYSILLSMLVSIKDVAHIHYFTVGVILTVPSIMFTIFIIMTDNYEKQYLIKNL